MTWRRLFIVRAVARENNIIIIISTVRHGTPPIKPPRCATGARFVRSAAGVQPRLRSRTGGQRQLRGGAGLSGQDRLSAQPLLHAVLQPELRLSAFEAACVLACPAEAQHQTRIGLHGCIDFETVAHKSPD